MHPASGVLEPLGRDGTTFVVSFTPSEYGKMVTGRLLIKVLCFVFVSFVWCICLHCYVSSFLYLYLKCCVLLLQTEDMQWSYEVRGTHPEYRAPRGHTKVSSHLNSKVARSLEEATHKPSRNIMRDNMRGARGKSKTAAASAGVRSRRN